jgi:glycosyltransferase involved in cell wall biosynthesis
MPLKIAAKVDDADRAYFRDEIAPLLDAAPQVDFVGEIGDAQKSAFLGGAEALLFPIAWPEPFGLVMIEAMACGTPVIAYDCGSVREVVEDGVTGVIVRDEAEAVAAIPLARRLDRLEIRRRFETRFSATAMAGRYLDLYRRLADSARAKPPLAATA